MHLADHFVFIMSKISKTTSISFAESHFQSEPPASATSQKKKIVTGHEEYLNPRNSQHKSEFSPRAQLPPNLLDLPTGVQQEIADRMGAIDHLNISCTSKQFKKSNSPFYEGIKAIGLSKQIKESPPLAAEVESKFNHLFQRTLELSHKSRQMPLLEFMKNSIFADHILAAQTPAQQKFIQEISRHDQPFSYFIKKLETQAENISISAIAEMVKACGNLPSKEYKTKILEIGEFVFKRPPSTWSHYVKKIEVNNNIPNNDAEHEIQNHVALINIPTQLENLPDKLNHLLLASTLLNCSGLGGGSYSESYASVISAAVQAAIDLPIRSGNHKNLLLEAAALALSRLKAPQVDSVLNKKPQFEALLSGISNWSDQHLISLKLLANRIYILPEDQRGNALHDILKASQNESTSAYDVIETVASQIKFADPLHQNKLFDAALQLAHKNERTFGLTAYPELITNFANLAPEARAAAINNFIPVLNREPPHCRANTLDHLIRALACPQEQLHSSEFAPLLQMSLSLIQNETRTNESEGYLSKPMLTLARHAHKFPVETQADVYVKAWKSFSNYSSFAKKNLRASFDRRMTDRLQNDPQVQRQLSRFVNMKAAAAEYLENVGNQVVGVMEHALRMRE